ncbi:MAG: LLM class flavin-dependent oxidoreductase [Novosphingobium sp.]|nr:LLM class flavin-dependent oxidoreductase [Novosphingobium sp.]MCP5401480.1 LLM class flavin-dependent oxidoreductase [Novosphingobium sp.]
MSSKVSFGYLYDFRNPPQWHRPWAELYAEMLDLVAWTEEAGFDGAWVPEHHLADDGYMPSPLVALTAMAARTSRITLGSGIALAPLYNPMRFAEDAAVADIIAGGRLEIGLAIGYRRRETAAFGVDFTKRGRMFDEWLEIVTRLWAGETVDFAGQFYNLTGAKVMPPAPRGRIPIYVGGFNEKAMARVARYGDGYIGNPEVFSQWSDKLEGNGSGGNPPGVAITALFNAVAEDPEKAMDEIAPYYHHVNNSYGQWFNEDRALGLDEGMQPMDLDAFKQSGVLQIWTPAEAIEKLKAMQEAVPLKSFMMMMPAGMPAKMFVEYAELFAGKVVPAFR